MKRFLKQISIIALGTILGGIIIVGLALGTVLVIQKQKFKSNVPSKLTSNTILRINLHGQLVEEIPAPFVNILGKNKIHEIDLVTIKKAIRTACEDSRISGIYLDIGHLGSGWATLAELRSALATFKKTGKFIIAYAEHYTSKTYYLASLADEIVLHPSGSFAFIGLNMTVLFYKELLDKLEILPQIFRVGQYKSAVEPFTGCSMSEASKEQNQVLLNTIYDNLIETLATARNLTPNALKAMACTLSVTQPQEACKARLVTHVGYFSDVENLIKDRTKLKSDTKITYIDFDGYQNKHSHTKRYKQKIAVLIAAGTIVDEELSPNQIAAKNFIKTLKELREDPNVKAIVIRINSPGGSALASDTIWKELMLTRVCKPVVASMSDMAASGGYYIATGCNHIIAHPTTITGSIGIFGLYFDVHALLKNKLGVYGDVVKTSPSADIFNPTRPLAAQEKIVIQKHIEEGYHKFLDRIVIGRQMHKEDVARLAEGRVWPGSLAKKHGLVDELGGLEDAIEKAVLLADLNQPYQVDYWPKHKTTLLKELITYWQNIQTEKLLQSYISKPYYLMLKSIQELINNKGIQAWFPYTVEIE